VLDRPTVRESHPRWERERERERESFFSGTKQRSRVKQQRSFFLQIETLNT